MCNYTLECCVLGYRRVWHSGGILSYKTQVWLLPELEAGIFVVANGPLTEKWHMVNIAMHITDHLAGETPWLDTNTSCTFPAPWQQQEETLQNETHQDADDPTQHPLEYYTGKYSNPAFGEIRILKNISTNRLKMNMGRFLEADLMYDQKTNTFFSKLINKYWYMNLRIPLEFKKLETVDGKHTFSSIYMPLYPPYHTTLKLEFKKNVLCVSQGNSNACFLSSFYWASILLTIYMFVSF